MRAKSLVVITGAPTHENLTFSMPCARMYAPNEIVEAQGLLSLTVIVTVMTTIKIDYCNNSNKGGISNSKIALKYVVDPDFRDNNAIYNVLDLPQQRNLTTIHFFE